MEPQTQSKPQKEDKTIYEQIGGEATVRKVVAIFYEKILADDSVSGYFKDINMEKQLKQQFDFICVALGGPNPQQYKGKNMREAHKHLNLKASDFDAIVGHLGAALGEVGCPENLIGQIAGALGALKDEVLNN
jgi:hemoglobin